MADHSRQLTAAAGREFQVLPPQFHAASARPPRLHVMVTERRHHVDLSAGTAYGDVEPPFPAGLIQRAETVGQRPILGLVVSGAEDNHVPFITLNPLDALHEERLLHLSGEEPVKGPVSQCQGRRQNVPLGVVVQRSSAHVAHFTAAVYTSPGA